MTNEVSVEPVAILRAARARIEDEPRWTKDATARNAAGNVVMSTDYDACRWCAVGALNATLGGDWGGTEHGKTAYDFLREVSGGIPVVHFNDHPKRTHAEVLAAFDRAIALAESAQ